MNVSQNAVARGGKFWARLCALPAFSFLLNGTGGVARVKNPGGNWIELSEVQQIIDDAESRITELERYKAAVDEWLQKTEWVQNTSRPQELGKHRADVLRERIEALQIQAAETQLSKALDAKKTKEFLNSVQTILTESKTQILDLATVNKKLSDAILMHLLIHSPKGSVQ